jgi:hypothetical protein
MTPEACIAVYYPYLVLEYPSVMVGVTVLVDIYRRSGNIFVMTVITGACTVAA